jgi:WD repeat-containing protein 45
MAFLVQSWAMRHYQLLTTGRLWIWHRKCRNAWEDELRCSCGRWETAKVSSKQGQFSCHIRIAWRYAEASKVIIWDEAKEKAVITLEFRTAVQRVRVSRSRIIVALLNSVNVYKFSAQVEKLSTFDTANNPYGLCCLGTELFAFPGRTPGQVQLVRISNNIVSIIPAHNSPLSAIELSPDGEMLATASENGTLIRVWSTSSSNKVAELRRGVDPASIFSLAISPSNTMLAVTSDKSTLHIFDLPNSSQPLEQKQTSSSVGYSSSNSSREMIQGGREGSPSKQKWGLLSQIPLMPRVFSDTYSFASAHFEIGDEPVPTMSKSPTLNAPIPGVPGGRPPKGIIGWVSDDSLVVLSAGQDARWEKFLVGPAEDGTRVCWREGWRRYLDN